MANSEVQDYCRIPERLWEDPGFRTLPKDAKLLYLHLCTGPYRRPRSCGLVCAGPAVIAEHLGSDWTVEDVLEAGKILSASGLVEWDKESRTWWAPGVHFSVTNARWWKGRMRSLANMPDSPQRTQLLLRTIRECPELDEEDRGFVEALFESGMIDEGVYTEIWDEGIL
ncbi:MAG: hypothetical protein GY835_00555 [bacterium]|nr:hypothetical protein [bacterium]